MTKTIYYLKKKKRKVLVTCILGPFLISLMNVMIANIMLFNREEQKAYDKIKLTEAYDLMNHKAASFIQNTYKLHCRLKKLRIDNTTLIDKKINKLDYKFKISFNNFLNHKR